MTTDRIIQQFADRHAPQSHYGQNSMARHNLQTLSRHLNIEPKEVINLCEAGLLQAAEPWPGAPSLTFSNAHLNHLRKEICLQHAADTIELCGAKQPGEIQHILEMSWQKRSAKVIELSAKH